LEKALSDCANNQTTIVAQITYTKKWIDKELEKIDARKTKSEELVTKMDEKAKDYIGEEKKCLKPYSCKIFRDKMTSAGARKKCIAMSDVLEPQIKCYYEEFPEEEKKEAGYLKKNFGYSLVRIDKRLLRCKSPKKTEAAPERFKEFSYSKLNKINKDMKSTNVLHQRLKKKKGGEETKDDVKIDFDLPVFNITNPNECLPCGASGYVPYQCHVGAEIFTTNYARFKEYDGTACST